MSIDVARILMGIVVTEEGLGCWECKSAPPGARSVRDEELGMKVVARAAVLGLAGLTAFGAAGCNRGGGNGGTTTIIQQAPPVNGDTKPTSSMPNVNQAKIGDPKKLCNLEQARGQEIVNAIDAFWKLAIKDGWSWSDPNISGAADNANQVVSRVAPIMEAAIGNGIPDQTANAIHEFIKSSRDFSTAINNRENNEVLDPLNKSFGASVDELQKVCRV